MDKALRKGIIRHDPFENFSSPRVQTKAEYLTVAEQHRALKWFKQGRLLKITTEDKRGKTYNIGKKYHEILQHFLIGCFSGLRMSDIATLRMEHIDLENKLIVKKMVKGKKDREKTVTIPLTPQLEEVLDLTSDHIPYLGKVRMKNVYDMNVWLRELLHDHIEICKGKHITFHCSRHTFGVTCLTLGVPLETVQDIMGHSDIKTTQIYAKVVEEKKKSEMTNYWSRFNEMARR